jgi:hypothetical protein
MSILKLSPILFLIFLCSVISIPLVYAETLTQAFEGGMDLEIIYPESVMNGRMFSISIHLENNGWENKQDISFVITNADSAFKSLSDETITIEQLTTTSSFGTTLDYEVSKNTNEGTHFLNILYSQILVSNNVDPMPATKTTIALPITVLKEPVVKIQTTTPESIFSNTEFPFEVNVISEYIELKDLTVQIIVPQDIEFRGDTSYGMSLLEKGTPFNIKAEMITPSNVSTEHTIPVKVVVSYTDDLGNEKSDSSSVPLLLRPKTFLEITNDGGIWVGDFFIAPYVSIGTIVGIPAGTIFSLLLKRAVEKKKKKKKS